GKIDHGAIIVAYLPKIPICAIIRKIRNKHRFRDLGGLIEFGLKRDLGALSKAREDNERHQESRQDWPDQIMLQQVGAIRGTANKLCFVFSCHGKAKINFALKE
nr:hypothetical protein [Tanacetum cinerariifolium]